MRHSNVAIFVPHIGCPNKCSFCNQNSITGQIYAPTALDVQNTLEKALISLKDNAKNAEIAFFGGSFTAINSDYLHELLSATKKYIDKFKGIRISTRPDCIDENILSVLKKYGVTSIELGAQSMCDDVLAANDRGHSANDVIIASNLIKSQGFSLGLQMMTGLYKSTYEKDIFTANEFIKLKPDTVRIYPTIIMKNTHLAKLFECGNYSTYSLDRTVDLCAELLTMFNDNGIKVIRVGLHDSQTLKTDMLSGPYHPAFKELCESKIMYNNVINELNKKHMDCTDIKISVNPKSISKLIGQNKSNLLKLNKLGYKVKLSQDINLNEYEIYIEQR